MELNLLHQLVSVVNNRLHSGRGALHGPRDYLSELIVHLRGAGYCRIGAAFGVSWVPDDRPDLAGYTSRSSSAG